MERTDWTDESQHKRGLKFIEEIQKIVPDDYRMTESGIGREVLWRIDDTYLDEVIELYKKLFPFEFLFKKIKLYE